MAIPDLLSSRIYNTVVARLARIELHDMNCGFKVYRRTVIENVRLYSDLHRYVPVLAAWQGFRVTEQVIQHHPRHTGDSKYGTGRATRGFMDLVMVLFITRYLRSRLRLFGWLGFFVLSGGGLINLYLALLWFLRLLGLADVPPIGTRPLFSVGILAMILGVQLVSLGLLGEWVRTSALPPCKWPKARCYPACPRQWPTFITCPYNGRQFRQLVGRVVDEIIWHGYRFPLQIILARKYNSTKANG